MRMHSFTSCLVAAIFLAIPTARADIAQLFIYPGNVGIVRGATQHFRVFALDARGNEVPVSGTVSWTADPTVGSIDQSGFFKAGTVARRSVLGVRASLATGVQSAAVVEVLPFADQGGMVLDHLWRLPIPGSFEQPPCIATDIYGNLYVSGPGCLEKFSSSGSYTGLLDTFGPKYTPIAVTCVGNNIYALWNGLAALSSTGTVVRTFTFPYGVAQTSPTEIAVDEDGNVYVACGNILKFGPNGTYVGQWQTSPARAQHIAVINSCVYVSSNLQLVSQEPVASLVSVFDTDGNLLRQWGGVGTDNGRFKVAGGIAPDQYGRICVVDQQNRRVQVFEQDGTYVTQWPASDAGGASPLTIASDSQGRFYILYSDGLVRQYDSHGVFIKQIGVSQNTQRYPGYPDKVVPGPDGGVFVCDSMSGRVFVLDSAGDPVRNWTYRSIESPGYLAGNDTGAYIWDGVSKVAKYDPFGSVIGSWTVPITNPPYQEDLRGVAILPSGNLCLADTTANKIYVLDSQSNVVSKWGQSGTDTPFSGLLGVATDELGRVYSTDANRVEEFSERGNYLTQWIAGAPTALAARNGTVLVWEATYKRLSRTDPSGNALGSWTAPDTDRYTPFIRSVCIDKLGSPRLTDPYNDRIYSLTVASSTVPKAKVDGAFVYLKDVPVTAGSSELGDCFYIESPDRSAGIRVTGQTATRGQTITLSGVLSTSDGERRIEASSVSASSKQISVAPVGMSLTSVGGGASGSQIAPWAWRWVGTDDPDYSEYKWVQLWGLSTTGLFVRTWGEVDSVDASANAFVITDGNMQFLKCRTPALVHLPEIGQFVCLTGISSTELNGNGELEPVLRIRSQSDVIACPQ